MRQHFLCTYTPQCICCKNKALRTLVLLEERITFLEYTYVSGFMTKDILSGIKFANSLLSFLLLEILVDNFTELN